MPDLTAITDDEIVRTLLAAVPDGASLGESMHNVLAAVRQLLDRPRPGYTYRAVVVDWTDGDTVHLDIDLGLRQWAHDEPIRLLGVNAPDRKPLKAKATLWMRDAAPEGTDLIVRTHLDEQDKYGRLLGDLYLPATATGEAIHLNAALIDAGLGQPYAGGSRPVDY